MSLLMLCAVSVGGGLGAAARFSVDTWLSPRLSARAPGNIPLATSVINVTACFLLGLLLSWVATATSVAPPSGAASSGYDLAILSLLLGSGFLGGYSTFSTAMVDSARLIHAGNVRSGILLVLATAGLSIVAALCGVWLGYQ